MALLLVPQTNTLFWKPPGILPCGRIVKREGDAEKKEKKKRAFSEFVFALSCFFGQLEHRGVPFSRLEPLMLALQTGHSAQDV